MKNYLSFRPMRACNRKIIGSRLNTGFTVARELFFSRLRSVHSASLVLTRNVKFDSISFRLI